MIFATLILHETSNQPGRATPGAHLADHADNDGGREGAHADHGRVRGVQRMVRGERALQVGREEGDDHVPSNPAHACRTQSLGCSITATLAGGPQADNHTYIMGWESDACKACLPATCKCTCPPSRQAEQALSVAWTPANGDMHTCGKAEQPEGAHDHQVAQRWPDAEALPRTSRLPHAHDQPSCVCLLAGNALLRLTDCSMGSPAHCL